MSLRFSTVEYSHRERNLDWYWILGIIAIATGIACVILGNTLFGIVIIIGSFGTALYTARKPENMTVEINDKGILIDKTLYPYTALESFCVSRDTHPERLRIRSKKKLMPLMSVIISGTTPDEVEQVVEKYLSKENFEISFLEKIMEAIGL